MMRSKPIALIAFLTLITGAAATAVAVPITFEYRGEARGFLNDQGNEIPIDDEGFVIRAFGDTNNRSPIGGGYFINHLAAEIEFDGIGLLHFLTPTQTQVDNSSNVVRFARGAGPLFSITQFPGDDLETWNMLSSLGPITGDGPLRGWNGSSPVVTDRGPLFLDHFVEGAFFIARVENGQAPEPVSWTLMAVGLLSAGLLRRRRQL